MTHENKGNEVQLSQSELIEVSYAVIEVKNESLQEVLQNFATAINVELKLEGNVLPFVPFNSFNNAKQQQKIFLYGPSGCGKSRSIFEFVTSRIKDYDKLYVVNPRNPVGNEIKRANILEIITGSIGRSAIVWDNFPDDLVRRDIESVVRVLELLTSQNKDVFVALKPRYLELYRGISNRIPEFNSYEISYDKVKIKDIVQTYGLQVDQFRDEYYRYISNDIEKIASILWNKEPLPLAVLDYYKNLIDPKQIPGKTMNPIQLAEKWLPATDYYRQQFELLTNLNERKNDTEFLYTLKVCYELGLDRTGDLISKLQQGIFNSMPNTDPLKNLGTWIYMSGGKYSMHDVIRDAVIFNESVRTQITSYLTNNFSQFIQNSESQDILFGLFFGRNIDCIPRDLTHPFVPDQIYHYMKNKRYFEVGLGEGSGEVILSLDDDLQKEVLGRAGIDIEFSRGLAGSLGRNFPFVEEYRRKQIMKLTHNSWYFTRFFGESIGKVFTYLSKEMQNEFFELIDRDASLAEGLGMGLGSIFASLNTDLSKQILFTAKENNEFTRGLGQGFVLGLASLGNAFQTKFFADIEANHELALGAGLGFGASFPFLPQELRQLSFEKATTNIDFAWGFGIYAAFLFTFLPQEVQRQILTEVDRNPNLGLGLGLGFGFIIQYLPQDFKDQLLSKAGKNVKLATGIGFGIGVLFRYYSNEAKNQIYKMCSKNIGLASGLGLGFGFGFNYLEPDLRREVLEKAAKDNALAFDLGFGFGKLFRYRPDSMQKELLELADKNSEFATGLGKGLGYTFDYQHAEFKKMVASKIETTPQLNLGFGIGVGWIFKYFPKNRQDEIVARAQKNVHFAYGFGTYLGQLFTYFSEHERQEILRNIEHNMYLSLGLGYGIGYIFLLLSEETRKKIFDKAERNHALMQGLGRGLGSTFGYLDTNLQQKIISKAEQDSKFAEGLGYGLGYAFPYLANETQQQFFYNGQLRNDGITRGLGTGLGTIFTYLAPELQNQIFARAEQNHHFANGLGRGLGWIFTYISQTIQKDIQKRAEHNLDLAKGLGHTLGQILDYPQQNQFLNDGFCKNSSFLLGFASGTGTVFSSYSEEKQKELIGKAVDTHYAEGLGYGLGQSYPFFSEELSLNLLEQAEQYPELVKSLAFSIGQIFVYLDVDLRDHVLIYAQNDSKGKFAEGLSDALGHVFPSLDSRLQEKLLSIANTNQRFATGLGTGIGHSFSYLDNIARSYLLEAAEKNQHFASGLGFAFGNSLISFSPQLQEEILIAAEKKNCKFLTSFRESMPSNLGYCDENLRDRISKVMGIQLPSIDYTPEINVPITKSSFSSRYDEFLLPNSAMKPQVLWSNEWSTSNEEVSFSGQRLNCCVCFIDMIGSTKVAAQLNGSQVSKYYSIFLNAMATIARNFGARIIKNAGDALIYYFPRTSNRSDTDSFQNVVDCGVTIIAAHPIINAILQSEKLPPMNYRISVDYGEVHLAKSTSSQSDDLFGATVNMCAKINSKAKANGMVIGENLHEILKAEDGLVFEKVGDYSVDMNNNRYAIYSVEEKQKKIILNPFKRVSE